MMAGTTLLPWVLEETLVWQLAGLVAVLGMLSMLLGWRRAGFRLLLVACVMTVLPIVMAPVLGDVLAQVPDWLVILLAIILASYIVRLILALFIGPSGVGPLLAACIVGLFRALLSVPGQLARLSKRLGGLLRSPLRWQRTIGWVLSALLIGLAGAAGYRFGDNSPREYLSAAGRDNGRLQQATRDPGTEAAPLWLDEHGGFAPSRPRELRP